MLEEGTISTQDSVQDLKTENDDLASKLAKAERNVEKCRDEIMRLRNEAKEFRVDLQTVESETAQLKTSTNVAASIEPNTM
jgi:predicted  nucleic acid-binding Zn-ribbon protein